MSNSHLLLPAMSLACILAVFLAGCTQPQGPGGITSTPTPTGTQGPILSFNQDSNGKNVTIGAGPEFSLSLPENPTTGYSWNLSHSAGITLTRDEYIPPTTQLMGAGGIHTWIFVGKEKGSQAIHAEYRRPWVPAGTMTYQDLEGGFFGIMGDDGIDYLPLNLDTQYRVDGMRVAFESEEAEDFVTIQMWGTLVNISFIEQIQTFNLHVNVN